ncbi:nucleoside-diphosphate kinase [Candidatus Woesearchaeota archaeon CG_4_10_14_0_8_um_filter_47_5]|nr:MAG: nucleoside-diphosphate kinase [Candidatus Woesearchaeota archaeon CG_4_10_14_0_8_um_filter_47_5]
MEQTLIILKPDALNRGLVGEIIHRFEAKGLKIIGMKMVHLDDALLERHYAHHVAKPFYPFLRDFMKRAPSIVLVLEGQEAVAVVRSMAGETHGVRAIPGTIRGDYSLSQQANVVHASDTRENAKKEIERFFADEELYTYQKIDSDIIYSEDERNPK